MAAARSLTAWAAQVEDSSIVTTMARNGTTFGIRLPGSDRWFTAAAPRSGTRSTTRATARRPAPDIGDSAVLELVGLGAARGGRLAGGRGFLGGDLREAARRRRGSRRSAPGRSSRFKLPAMGTRAPRSGSTCARSWSPASPPRSPPASCTLSDGTGQVGAGVATAPAAVFRDALLALRAD